MGRWPRLAKYGYIIILQFNNIVIIYDINGIYDMAILILLMQYRYLKGILYQNILSPASHFIVIGCSMDGFGRRGLKTGPNG